MAQNGVFTGYNTGYRDKLTAVGQSLSMNPSRTSA